MNYTWLFWTCMGVVFAISCAYLYIFCCKNVIYGVWLGWLVLSYVYFCVFYEYILGSIALLMKCYIFFVRCVWYLRGGLCTIFIKK